MALTEHIPSSKVGGVNGAKPALVTNRFDQWNLIMDHLTDEAKDGCDQIGETINSRAYLAPGSEYALLTRKMQTERVAAPGK